MPLVALYSGARLNEICQLATDDVQTMDGVQVIVIRAGGGRLAKTAAATFIFVRSRTCIGGPVAALRMR